MTKLTQGELLDLPNPTPDKPAVPLRAPAEGLAAMRARHRSEAAAITIDEAWLPAQAAWLESECERFARLLTLGMAACTQATDSRWPKVWRLQALYEYLHDTLTLVQKQGHVVVCLCGQGFGAPVPVELAHRQLVDEGSGQWLRYCTRCQESSGIALRTAALQRSWQAK